MNVCIDHRWVGHHGIARYATEITKRLPWACSLTSQRVRPATLADPLWLRHALRRRGASVFFSPGYNVAASPLPQVVVLHDLIHLLVPEESTPLKRAYYERLVRPAVLRTGSVVTVSEFSKSTIVAWCGIAPEHVTVAPPALSGAFLAGRQDTDPSMHLSGAQPYVLYVGNGKPHKNLGLLLRAMDELPHLRLLCVGVRSDEFRQEGWSGGRGAELLSGLPDDRLAELYRSAACLAFPSVHEGFGLPALEALSQGTSVAYVSEAVGETVGPSCGVRADPDGDASGFAEAILRAIELRHDPHFAPRAMDRASTFSWDESAALIRMTIQAVASTA